MSKTQRGALICSPRSSSKGDPNAPVLAFTSIPDSLPANHILVRVEKFGFSANNITYQALGEHPHFRYYDFHAVPPGASDTGEVVSATSHGLIPVWGFGTVVASTHPKIEVSEKVYGYFAPVQYLLLPVASNDVNKYAFYVPRPHLPPDRRPYNQIIRCSSDPQYNPSPEAEDLTMLYRPLFWTSFWCEDWLNASGYTQPSTNCILISSASSKTAFCLAYRLQIRRKQAGSHSQAGPLVIGLTSKRNLSFTKALGLYDRVLSYDEYETSSLLCDQSNQRWVYVDVAGNESLNNGVLNHFCSPYRGKIILFVELGMTNLSPTASVSSGSWSTTNLLSQTTAPASSDASKATDLSTRTTSDSIYPPRTSFFMPEWLAIRRRQLSIGEITSRQAQAWAALMEDCKSWVKLRRFYGPQNVKDAYESLVKDGVGPDVGLVWSMWEEGSHGSASIRARL